VDLGGANTTSMEVRAFYSCWLNFTTRKEFAWADKYNPTAAPDRKTRRLMEEENGKVRAASCPALHSHTPHSPCPLFPIEAAYFLCLCWQGEGACLRGLGLTGCGGMTLQRQASYHMRAPVVNPSQSPPRACGWFIPWRNARGQEFR